MEIIKSFLLTAYKIRTHESCDSKDLDKYLLLFVICN